VENLNTKFTIKYLFGLQTGGKSYNSDTMRYLGNVACKRKFEMFMFFFGKNKGKNQFGDLDLLTVICN
jgi:hypothetical protein